MDNDWEAIIREEGCGNWRLITVQRVEELETQKYKQKKIFSKYNLKIIDITSNYIKFVYFDFYYLSEVLLYLLSNKLIPMHFHFLKLPMYRFWLTTSWYWWRRIELLHRLQEFLTNRCLLPFSCSSSFSQCQYSSTTSFTLFLCGIEEKGQTGPLIFLLPFPALQLLPY